MAFDLKFQKLNNPVSIPHLYDHMIEIVKRYNGLYSEIIESHKKSDSNFCGILKQAEKAIRQKLYIKNNSPKFQTPVCISFNSNNQTWELHINNKLYDDFFKEKNRINHSLKSEVYINRLKLRELWHFLRGQETKDLNLHSNIIRTENNINCQQEFEKFLADLFSFTLVLGDKSTIREKLENCNYDINRFIMDTDYFGKIGYKDAMQCIAYCNPTQFHFLEYVKTEITDKDRFPIVFHNIPTEVQIQSDDLFEGYKEIYIPRNYTDLNIFKNYNYLLNDQSTAFHHSSHTDGFVQKESTINHHKYICNSVGITNVEAKGKYNTVYKITKRILCLGRKVN